MRDLSIVSRGWGADWAEPRGEAAAHWPFFSVTSEETIISDTEEPQRTRRTTHNTYCRIGPSSD